MHKYQIVLFSLIACLVGTKAIAEPIEDCGSLATFSTDYRTATPDQKHLVESAHFTPQVETLRRGASSSVGEDLNFTLRTYPNHHRALMAMMNLSFKQKLDKPNGAAFTVECYFDRAIRFRPDDEMVRLVHGIYLLKKGKGPAAIKEFELARKDNENNANLIYNLGLAYFETKNYEQSLAFAHEAYRLGYPLDGLRRKLVAVGKWREPVILAKPEGNTPELGGDQK